MASQAEWISVIAIGMARSFNCHGLISDHSLHPSSRARLSRSNLVQLTPDLCQYTSSRFGKILFFVKHPYLLLALLVYPLLVNRFSLLLRLPWTISQQFHAIWDTAVLQSTDTQLSPNYLQKLSATYQCFVQYYYAELYYRNGVTVAILGHKVYSTRTLKVALERLGISVFFHTGGVIHKSSSFPDTSIKSRSRKEWLSAIPEPPAEEVNKYLHQRQTGSGLYYDSTLASVEKSDHLTPSPNQLFLHIFRDSPFYQIDLQRIYADYIHWFQSTLAILTHSSEQWDIRIHPSSALWGEDAFLLIRSILSTTPLPDNCRLLKPNAISNIRVFQSARRIVTYSGTSALEAATFGLKPITISTSTLSSYDANLCFKPLTRSSYRDLLLCSSSSSEFCLSSSQIYRAKELQHINDNLSSLSRIVGHLPVYRTSSPQTLLNDYASVVQKLDSSPYLLSYLQDVGTQLMTGQVTFSTCYNL